MAILAALECMYACFPHITLPQYLIALEVRKTERDGEPHTLASLVKKLEDAVLDGFTRGLVADGRRGQHRRDPLSEPSDRPP